MPMESGSVETGDFYYGEFHKPHEGGTATGDADQYLGFHSCPLWFPLNFEHLFFLGCEHVIHFLDVLVGGLLGIVQSRIALVLGDVADVGQIGHSPIDEDTVVDTTATDSTAPK